MAIAKLTVLVINLVALLLAAHFHGKSRPGKINFWVVFLGVTANLAILAAAGLFNGLICLE